MSDRFHFDDIRSLKRLWPSCYVGCYQIRTKDSQSNYSPGNWLGAVWSEQNELVTECWLNVWLRQPSHIYVRKETRRGEVQVWQARCESVWIVKQAATWHWRCWMNDNRVLWFLNILYDMIHFPQVKLQLSFIYSDGNIKVGCDLSDVPLDVRNVKWSNPKRKCTFLSCESHIKGHISVYLCVFLCFYRLNLKHSIKPAQLGHLYFTCSRCGEWKPLEPLKLALLIAHFSHLIQF